MHSALVVPKTVIEKDMYNNPRDLSKMQAVYVFTVEFQQVRHS